MSCDNQLTPTDLENAKLDVITQAEIATSRAGGEASGARIFSSTDRFGDEHLTSEGALARIESNPINGGVWASGVTIEAYNDYMNYNGVAYKAKQETPLPYVTTSPDATLDAGVEPFDRALNSGQVAELSGVAFQSVTEMADPAMIKVTPAMIDAAAALDNDILTKTGEFHADSGIGAWDNARITTKARERILRGDPAWEPDWINGDPVLAGGSFGLFGGSDYVAVYLNDKNIDALSFGLFADSVTSDVAAFQAAIDSAPDFSEILLPPKGVLLDAEIDARGKQNLTFTGVKRATRLLFNHNSASGINMNNGPFTSGTFRGITWKNIAFYSAFEDSDLPSVALDMRSCPESKIVDCTFINCATSAGCKLWESWSSEVSGECFFSAKENGLQPAYGAPNNVNASGSGLHIAQDSHAVHVLRGRYRNGGDGSPNILFEGGDACTIKGASIEGSGSSGILINNSSGCLKVANNYFEGSQDYDVVYTSSGTNYGHEISGNFFHAVNGVKIESGCDCNGFNLHDNYAFSNDSLLTVEDGTSFKGITSEKNTLRDVLNPYVIPASALKSVGLTKQDNGFVLNDRFIGSTPKNKGVPNDTIFGTIGSWDAFAGTGTITDSGVTHSGIELYTISATGTGSFVAFAEITFDQSLLDEYITVCLPMLSSDGSNISVVIDDGVSSRTYTLNSSTVGGPATDNIFYQLLANNATRLRIRVTVNEGESIQTLLPSVRRGAHDAIKYIDQR